LGRSEDSQLSVRAKVCFVSIVDSTCVAAVVLFGKFGLPAVHCPVAILLASLNHGAQQN
jgi:hypothetical protein